MLGDLQVTQVFKMLPWNTVLFCVLTSAPTQKQVLAANFSLHFFLRPIPCTITPPSASRVWGYVFLLLYVLFLLKRETLHNASVSQSFLSSTIPGSMDSSWVSERQRVLTYEWTYGGSSAFAQLWFHQSVSEQDGQACLSINLQPTECVCASVLSAWYGAAAYMI